jgi:hypoxanthine-guanine phosphoribosyltransferase
MLGALEDTFKPLDRNDIVFLDFSGIHWEKNTLSNFIRKIMYLQGNALAIGININRPHFKIIDEVNKIFLSGDSLISDFDRKITPLIDVTNDILFLGCKNDFEQNLLNELFQVEEVDLQSFITEDDEEELKKDKIRFLKRNVHLIGTSKNKLRIMASFKSGGDLLIDAIENMIKQLIEQPPLGIIIRHEDHIFHLPSGKYSSVYIQLSHILQFGNWAVRFAYSLITKLGLHFIDCKNINFIVGGTASVAPLLEAIAEGIGLLDDEKILCIETYIDTPYHNDFDDIPKDANVLIVTDVISTGGLIEKMVEAVVVRGANPKAIAAIVDTRVSSDVEIKVKDRTVSIYSLYSEPIKKTTNKVALGFDGQGKLIEDGSGIIEIDRLTATPYYEIVPAVPPLIDPKEFFEKHIKESFTISNRHIESGGTHFCFYIDTKKIFQNEIIRSELISTVVERLSKQLPKKIPNEITILYAWGSNATYAMPHLIAEIKKKTKISKIISRSIFRSKSVNGWRFGTPDKSYENIIRDRVVLIFDDGSNSGDTLTQLIDYSCSFSPRLLFLYILISRLEPFYRKFFQKIYAYGSSTKNVSCTFFTSLDIPTYKPNSCPCCNRERDIKADIMETFSVLEPVRHYLDRELRRIQSVRIRNIRKEIDERQYISLSELSADPEDSERFREEITRLIIVREAMAKLESLVPTEKDRVSLKDMMLDKNNLRMLVRIIRDEPHLWQKLASQCPDVINMLIMCCIDSLINVNSQYDAFDMAAMDIIFVTGNHGKIKDRLDKVILKTQASTDLLNSFIYYIFKFLNDDEIIQLLKESKDISEKDKSNDIGRKRNTRVQLSTALHWAILNRAKKVGTKGDIKKAIVWLKDIYDADPHKSFISLWNTIKETSLHYRMGKWAERYKWWLQIERLREEFITNIQTLQTILKHITGIDPYLISVPDVINSFTEIEKNLHKLSTEGLTPVESRKSYELFRSNIEKLHQKIIAKESKIATIMRGFPTEAEPEITSIEVMLGQSIMDNNIGLKISSFPNKCIKIICHNELFHDVFTEWIRNMCKHASANTAVTANLIISLTDQSLELKLIHDGSIAAGETKGYGETMIAEIMTDLGGRFDPPQSNLSGRIESKLIFERW